MSCLKSQPLSVLSPLTFGDEVNFRLTYGPLKAAGQSETRRLEKHEMRLAFAAQLSELFKSDELLLKPFSMSGAEYGETVADLAQKYRRGEYSFLAHSAGINAYGLRSRHPVPQKGQAWSRCVEGWGPLIIESRCSLML